MKLGIYPKDHIFMWILMNRSNDIIEYVPRIVLVGKYNERAFFAWLDWHLPEFQSYLPISKDFSKVYLIANPNFNLLLMLSEK